MDRKHEAFYLWLKGGNTDGLKDFKGSINGSIHWILWPLMALSNEKPCYTVKKWWLKCVRHYYLIHPFDINKPVYTISMIMWQWLFRMTWLCAFLRQRNRARNVTNSKSGDWELSVFDKAIHEILFCLFNLHFAPAGEHPHCHSDVHPRRNWKGNPY